MIVSGIAEFVSPFGRLSMMIDWKFLGLGAKQWQALHIVFATLFMCAGMLHIWINIKAIKQYLKNKSKKMVVFTKEISIALVIVAVLFIGTIQKFEPIDYFVNLNKSFNNYWIENFKKEQMR